MACDIFPPDFTTELGKVRYYSGDRELNSEGNYIIPDSVIRSILTSYNDKTSEVRVYKTTLGTILLMKSCFCSICCKK